MIVIPLSRALNIVNTDFNTNAGNIYLYFFDFMIEIVNNVEYFNIHFHYSKSHFISQLLKGEKAPPI